MLDLKLHQDDLIVATSGRSFWILDDLSLLDQYQPTEEKTVKLYEPVPAWNGSWNSPMNGNSESFKGMQDELGVNPANGVVVYYELPKLAEESEITLEILDANGKQVNKISSKKRLLTTSVGPAGRLLPKA